jgi:hypothetical protein
VQAARHSTRVCAGNNWGIVQCRPLTSRGLGARLAPVPSEEYMSSALPLLGKARTMVWALVQQGKV